MKILVTGASGFVGQHLVPRICLAKPQASVFATFQGSVEESSQIFSDTPGVQKLSLDMTNSSEVQSVMKEVQPDVIFHLAALSHVGASFQDPKKTLEVNLFGTLNLLEAAKATVPQSTILNIGSAEAYGKTFKDREGVSEEDPLYPLNPYAVSKASADLLMGQYAESTELKIIRLRPLNHIGPGQSLQFVVPDFASQLLKMRAQGGGSMAVGDLSPERDFLDVRDVIEAYLLIMDQREQLASGSIFNVCSGNPISVRTILNELMGVVGVEAQVEVDPNRLRPVEIRRVSCSNQKLRQLGWAPKIPLQQSLRDIVQSLAYSDQST